MVHANRKGVEIIAERRMFAKSIIDSDTFLDMPLSTQSLYFHLNMRADDEGFVNNPKKIQRMIGASDDDAKMLIAKRFVIPFESGVVVIKHWKIHNYIRQDRLNHTRYTDEKAQLGLEENGSYTLIEELNALESLDAKDARKLAYKNSSLPYSFNYKIKRAFEGRVCPCCGTVMKSNNKLAMPTVQHNVPISKGGIHELENISVICESCNTSIRDDETEPLNNDEVIAVWDKIQQAEKQGINWFWNLEELDKISVSDICQSSDGQMSAQVRLGKDRLGKDSIEKNTHTDEIKEIISYLNEKTGSKYRPNTDATKKHINARLDEGFTVDDFKTVIDIKTDEWLGDKDMQKFLRPQTLFGTKFESYLNQPVPSKKEKVEESVADDKEYKAFMERFKGMYK